MNISFHAGQIINDAPVDMGQYGVIAALRNENRVTYLRVRLCQDLKFDLNSQITCFTEQLRRFAAMNSSIPTKSNVFTWQ